MNTVVITSLCLLVIIVVIAYRNLRTKQPSDSALRQRAVFNHDEHLTFTRLKEILPDAHILAHVSFDALVTTKLPRTRRKYQTMFADFVILDKDCRVIAIVVLGHLDFGKRAQQAAYQDNVLNVAGYRVIRYAAIPEYQQLREDFLVDASSMQQDTHFDVAEARTETRSLSDYFNSGLSS